MGKSPPSSDPFAARNRALPAGPGEPSRHAKILWAGTQVVLGRFRAEAVDPDFRDAGPIGVWPEIAFPRVPVVIHQEGHPPFVADSTLAVFYNPRQPYRRSDLAGRGDHCEWLSVSPALLLEANPRLGDFGERFFPGTHALLAAPLCMRVRRIAHGALQGAHEPLRIEESLMRVIEGCCADRARGSRAGQGATARGRDRIQEAKALLAARLGERLALGEVAGKLGVSPYYLCRAFRAHTGTTLHGYRNELRLRAALEHLLERCDDLTRLALDLGFSSHSHFTAAFRRKFGTTPSRFRPGKRPT